MNISETKSFNILSSNCRTNNNYNLNISKHQLSPNHHSSYKNNPKFLSSNIQLNSNNISNNNNLNNTFNTYKSNDNTNTNNLINPHNLINLNSNPNTANLNNPNIPNILNNQTNNTNNNTSLKDYKEICHKVKDLSSQLAYNTYNKQNSNNNINLNINMNQSHTNNNNNHNNNNNNNNNLHNITNNTNTNTNNTNNLNNNYTLIKVRNLLVNWLKDEEPIYNKYMTEKKIRYLLKQKDRLETRIKILDTEIQQIKVRKTELDLVLGDLYLNYEYEELKQEIERYENSYEIKAGKSSRMLERF